MSVHVQVHLHIHEWWHCPDPGHHRVRLFVRARPAQALPNLCKEGAAERERGAEFNRMLHCDAISHVEWSCSNLWVVIIQHHKPTSPLIVFRLFVHQPHNSQIYLIPLIHHQPWRLKTSLSIILLGKNKGKVESECEQYCCPAHFQVSWGLA